MLKRLIRFFGMRKHFDVHLMDTDKVIQFDTSKEAIDFCIESRLSCIVFDKYGEWVFSQRVSN